MFGHRLKIRMIACTNLRAVTTPRKAAARLAVRPIQKGGNRIRLSRPRMRALAVVGTTRPANPRRTAFSPLQRTGTGSAGREQISGEALVSESHP